MGDKVLGVYSFGVCQLSAFISKLGLCRESKLPALMVKSAMGEFWERSSEHRLSELGILRAERT